MKHYPASRGPAQIEGLTISGPSPRVFVVRRSTALLILAVVASLFFFGGAIAFGAALVGQHSTPVSNSL